MTLLITALVHVIRHGVICVQIYPEAHCTNDLLFVNQSMRNSFYLVFWSLPVQFLHMPRQQSCRYMCKILQWSLFNNMHENQWNFHRIWNSMQKSSVKCGPGPQSHYTTTKQLNGRVPLPGDTFLSRWASHGWAIAAQLPKSLAVIK